MYAMGSGDSQVRIEISHEVAETLGADGLLSLEGVCRYRPMFRCPDCSRHGDLRTEPAAVVVFVPPQRDGACTYTIAHTYCTSSMVRRSTAHSSQHLAVATIEVDPGPAAVFFDVISNRLFPIPAIVVCKAITDITTVVTRSDLIVLDQQMGELRRAGFITYTVGYVAAPLPGWAIVLGPEDSLVEVTSPPGVLNGVPDGRWIRPLGTLAAPTYWREAAQRSGHALILFTPPYFLSAPDILDAPTDAAGMMQRPALRQAIDRGHVLAATVSVTRLAASAPQAGPW
jgi:hypothetical protein